MATRLIFAGVHLPTALVLGYLVYLRQSAGGIVGGGLGVMPIVVAASAVGWCLVRIRKRNFTTEEVRILGGMSFVYLLAFDGFTLWYRRETLPPLTSPWWAGVVA
jgi:hypothetical protein